MNSKAFDHHITQQSVINDLRQQLEHDRSIVADGVTAIKKALACRDWLKEGRGPYEWDDDKWHTEFAVACNEILEAVAPLAKVAADWSNCPKDGKAVAEARIDLKAKLAAAERERDAERQRATENVTALANGAGGVIADMQRELEYLRAEIKKLATLEIRLNNMRGSTTEELFSRIERAEAQRDALLAEITSQREALKEHFCQCETPYRGCQPIVFPPTCERCRKCILALPAIRSAMKEGK